MKHNSWIYETIGTSKRFTIRLPQCLLNATPLKLEIYANCFIYCICFRALFPLSVHAFGQPYSLTSFGLYADFFDRLGNVYGCEGLYLN